MDGFKRAKKRFGRRLKAIREQQLRITQEKLAEELGVSSVFLSRIERGTSSPSFKLLVQIAKALDLSLAELFETV